MHVLVVDDSPLMRRYVARTLQMTGLEIQILEAENGADAMTAAARVHPDLIITDLNMPVMGGKELIARLAGHPVLASTPILVLSADHSESQSNQLIHEGAAGFLTKPVTPERLREQLRELLPIEAREGAGRREEGGMTVPDEIVRSSFARIFETMYFPELTAAGSGSLDSPQGGAGARVSFSGAVTGQLRIAATARLAAQLAADFIAADAGDLAPDQADAIVRELANVACGSLLDEWMPGAKFEFGLPIALDSGEIDVVWPLRFAVDGAQPELAAEVRISRD